MCPSAENCHNILAPSILSADFSRLGEELALIEEAGARYVHMDVMDGVFVPNITIGPPVIEQLRKHSRLVFDAHLMIQDPARYVARFAEAGADIITFHLEAADRPEWILGQIRSAGKRAGVAIKPDTPVEALFPFVPLMDMALVMSVEPGFGGQSLIEASLRKAEKLRRYATDTGAALDIQMDGGIMAENLGMVLATGVNVAVVGSAIFDAADKPAEIRRLLAIMEDAR